MTFSRGEDVLRTATLEAPASSLTLRRAAAVVLGTALVTAAARITLPLPGTPVPFTLQPLAVLIVGGLLGPWLGAASLVLYLALGAAGLPVFTPSALLPYRYVDKVQRVGGLAVTLPPRDDADEEMAAAVLRRVDGLLIGGGVLGDRQGFAGQHGLVQRQAHRPQQPQVGRDHVAGRQVHDVAGDEFVDRDLSRQR